MSDSKTPDNDFRAFRRTVAPGIEIQLLESRDAKALFAVADRDRAHLRQWLP